MTSDVHEVSLRSATKSAVFLRISKVIWQKQKNNFDSFPWSDLKILYEKHVEFNQDRHISISCDVFLTFEN